MKEEDKWLDIESAPKDGSAVLLFFPGIHDCVHTARWCKKLHWMSFKEGWWAIDTLIDTKKYPPSLWRKVPHPTTDRIKER